MKLIATLSGSDGTFGNTYYDFTNIPQTYKHLRLYATLGTDANFGVYYVLPNSLGSTSFRYTMAEIDGTNAVGISGTNAYGAWIAPLTNQTQTIARFDINNYTFDTAGAGLVDRPSYRFGASCSIASYQETYYGVVIEEDLGLGPITSLRIYCNVGVHNDSKFYLFGEG